MSVRGQTCFRLEDVERVGVRETRVPSFLDRTFSLESALGTRFHSADHGFRCPTPEVSPQNSIHRPRQPLPDSFCFRKKELEIVESIHGRSIDKSRLQMLAASVLLLSAIHPSFMQVFSLFWSSICRRSTVNAIGIARTLLFSKEWWSRAKSRGIKTKEPLCIIDCSREAFTFERK